jgi:hypothetical protein
MEYLPGDFILTHGTGWLSRGIRFAQYLRFRGENRPYAYWNHAALIIGDNQVAQALSDGIVISALDSYPANEYQIVHVDQYISGNDRDEILVYAQQCIGRKYGKISILAILLQLVFGIKLFLTGTQTFICSGFVASALMKSSITFDKIPESIMPADLARKFNIQHKI